MERLGLFIVGVRFRNKAAAARSLLSGVANIGEAIMEISVRFIELPVFAWWGILQASSAISSFATTVHPS